MAQLYELSYKKKTSVPPRCQATIFAKTVYSDLSLQASEWASKPVELSPGVRIARTLVIDQPESVPSRIINTNDQAAHFKMGFPLGIPEPVECLPVKENQVESHTELSHLNALFDAIDPTVTEDEKAVFVQLVTKYQSIFSKGDHDLECTTAVKHRIDTGIVYLLGRVYDD
jgi:hypothetical protein